MDMAIAQSTPKTFDDFKREILTNIVNPSPDTTPKTIDQIKTEYNAVLRDKVEEVRISTEITITETDIQAVIDYMVSETIKRQTIDHIALENQIANAAKSRSTCERTTHPQYSQLRVDVRGGEFNGYTFEGNNKLYGVTYTDNKRTCERTYTLSFIDEDHPNPVWDVLYDAYRQGEYGRTHDVEMFIITNNNMITFPNTWSSVHGYDYTLNGLWDPRGFHGTTTKSYTPGQTIYVSNTWNHMMDTIDTNPRDQKLRVP